jgi:hypothetical protein
MLAPSGAYGHGLQPYDRVLGVYQDFAEFAVDEPAEEPYATFVPECPDSSCKCIC